MAGGFFFRGGGENIERSACDREGLLTGSAVFNRGSIERPHCHATTVTLTGYFAPGGISVSFRTLPSISAGPSLT